MGGRMDARLQPVSPSLSQGISDFHFSPGQTHGAVGANAKGKGRVQKGSPPKSKYQAPPYEEIQRTVTIANKAGRCQHNLARTHAWRSCTYAW